MNLFIDTISKEANIIIFDNNREIIDSEIFIIKGNESSLLIPKIDGFLKKNNCNYFDLENIVVVAGPGSFTGVRTTVLAANSINYIIKQNMTSLSYFDLYKNYPIIKSSSKRDSFVKYNENDEVKIIFNNEIEEYLKNNEIKTIYGNSDIDNIEIVENIDYNDIIKNIKFDNKKQIEALYIKKPNIC